MRGFYYSLFGAVLLLLLWTGASYHYKAVEEFAVRHLEDNAGESPKVHEKRQLQDPLPISSWAIDGPVLSASIPRIPESLSRALHTNSGACVSENDGLQLALALGLAGIVLTL